jgi:tripartite-type tricarboxylate transporter receptor subunit TctC
VARIIDAWVKSPAGASLLDELGMAPLGGTPTDLARQVAQELGIWRSVIEAAGMVVD